jgi:hypothetical protein
METNGNIKHLKVLDVHTQNLCTLKMKLIFAFNEKKIRRKAKLIISFQNSDIHSLKFI